MIKQLDQTLTDEEAKNLRAGILKTAKALDPLNTVNKLVQSPEASLRGLAEGVAQYWLSPFEASRKQKELKGLSKIQVYAALTLFNRAHQELVLTGPFNEDFEEMPANWQTSHLVRAAHKMRTNYTEILDLCANRLNETSTHDEHEGFVELLREANSTDTNFIILKKVVLGLADRSVMRAAKQDERPASIRKRHAEELAGNASGALSSTVNNPNATLPLAPLMLASVKELFKQPMLKALAARKL